MARDYFDESKDKKKKKTKAATTNTSQSSSVKKTNKTVNNVNDRAQNSTFLSGGGSTNSYQNQNQKPKTVKKPAAQKQTSTASTSPRQTTPQRTTDTGTGRRRYSRTEATDYNNNLKQTAARDSRTRARRTLNEVDDFARRTANRASAWEKENLSARNQMLETQRAAKNKKTAERASERMQNKYGKQELSEKQKAFSDYTSGVIQRKALGYAKTASDLLKTNEGYKAQGRWAQEDPEFARRISSHEFAKRADKAFNDYSVKQEEVQKRLSKIEDNASGAGKIALQAYGSGLEMGVDRLAGPLWAASMFASAYGNQRGQALKEGASDEQDSRAAFLGAGVEVATEYMFKPVAGIASKFGGKHSMDFAGKLAAKVTSKLTGNKARIADIAVRTLGSQVEEGLEEVAGWAVNPYAQNLAYKNDLQKTREANAHADYNDMQQSFWNQFDTEEEAQQAALYVNSDEFIDDQVKTYKESGATDEEARSMARILQKYFLAHFDNDEEAAEEAEAEMDRFVVGDVREKHDWKELGQTLASTFLLTGVTGGASSYYTNQIGNQMLQGEVGKDRVKQYTDIVIKYDPENAKDAKYVKDTIDNGGTPTGTQVYQVASQATEVLQDMSKREMASDQVKQRRMRDEDLQVAPVVMTARGPQFNEMTGKAYQASYDKALGVVRGVRKHGTDVGLSEDTLTSPETMRTAANAVAAYETGTITAEQINDLTIDNPEIRTIFELATGVDLAQYNVMKRGKIDEVASNNAMMNGLLANAADNYVQMARAEQKQWSNRTRGRVLNAMSNSFGEKGNLAMHDVLKAADPRNQQKYMLTARIAQNVYDYARRTDISWDRMKNAYKGSFKDVDIDAMKDVYDAAKMDKDKAETAYLGREVIAGESMRFEKSDNGVARVIGEFTNDSSRELTGEEDEAMRAVADRLGVNIRIVPDSEMTIDGRMSAGENAENAPHFNGSYDSSTNTILLAETNGLNDNILYAMSHETTHLLKQYAPDAYMKLSNYIMDKYYKNAPGKYEAEIKAKQDLYKRVANQDLSEEAALEEIIADATRDFWSDPEFVNQISNDIEEPGFFKSVVNAIRDMLRHIRNLLSSGHFDGTEHEDVLWDLLGTYSKAEKLWLDAYRQAARNRAQMAIDELQDVANGNFATEMEDRFSIVEDPELIKQLEADDHRNTYRAMTLIDGKLYPPMATQVRDANGKWTMQEGISLGQWVESDITTDPKMFNKEGKFLLKKDSGGNPVPAAYNPYIHSSDSMLNDQFAVAYKRPNMVVVEGEIPESELTSGYRAEHDLDDGRHVVAKDTTGITDWKAGVVQGKLSGKRTVFLTNHFKPTRIVPDSEVAKHIDDKVSGTGVVIPYNVVTPGVREELRKLGTQMAQSENPNYYVVDAEEGLTINDGNARWTNERIDDLIGRYGASNPDYSQAYAVLMNPRDFLHITIEDELLRKWRESAANQPEGLTYKESQRAVWDKSYLEGRLLDDQNFPLDEAELRGQTQTPFLYIRSYKSGQRVLGHEGRHRMRALMEAGVTSVPVVIEDPDTKTSKQNVDSMILGYQEDVYNGAGIVRVNDLVPIRESNRDELIQKFGGDAQIRFSLSSSMEAVGCDMRKENGLIVATDSQGNRVDKFTEGFIRKSPLGRVLEMSAQNNILAKSDVNAQVKFLRDLYNMILTTQDPDLIWAVSGTIGYDPAHLINEDTPQEWIKEQKSKFASITGNADPQYKTTIDFTTICVKTQAVIDAMSATMKQLHRGLSEHEIIDIVYNETQMAGEQVPCPVCYVFSRWVGLGKLFGNIKEYQQKFPEDMDMTEIRAEYEKILAEVDKLVEKQTGKKSSGKARTKIYKETIERQNKLELPGKELTKEEEKELEDIKRRLDILDRWSWLEKTRLADDYKEVPDDILFDINAGRKFATEYPATWRFRTTRGPSLGKAAAPYSPSRLGDTIRGIASPSSIREVGESDRVFLEEDNKTAKTLFDKAVLNAQRQNRMNGQRLQSTSDFRFEYGLDYLLSFIELGAIGAKAQMYTKVPEAVKFLASTGAEVNCSIMPKGTGVVWNEETGEWDLEFSDVTGMAWEDAKALSKAYNNVQPILVAIGKQHLISAMANEDITMIIPFHASGSSQKRYISMMRTVGEEVKERTDFAKYESEHVNRRAGKSQKLCRDIRTKLLMGEYQNTELTEEEREALGKNEILRQLFIRVYGKDENGNEAKPDPKYVENFDENGNDADCYGVFLNKDQAGVMMPYEYWDKTSTIETADEQGKAYVDYCKSLGLRPVFSGYSTGSKYDKSMDFSSYPGYWKVLIDRCMYNLDGSYHKQQAVNVKNVDMDMLDSEQMRDGIFKPLQVNNPEKTADIANRSMERISAETGEEYTPIETGSQKYSISETDSEGNALTAGQAEYFANSKARDEQGRLVPVYHTTNDGGFTVFDPYYSDDHRCLFFSSDYDVSQSYGEDAEQPIDINRGVNEDGTIDVQQGYYKVYLNLENPMVIDGQGQDWDDITIGKRVLPKDSHLEIYSKDYLAWSADNADYMYKMGQAHRDGSRQRSEVAEMGDSPSAVLKFENGERIVVKADNKDALKESVAKTLSEHYNVSEDAVWKVANTLVTRMGLSVNNGHTWLNSSMINQLTGETHTTREWAEIAQAQGHDGVIFRNIVDIGSWDFFSDEIESDIYVAFSGNQVKDINNENPTAENPDIRYSIPDEDMVKSYIEQNVDDIHDIPLVDFMLEQNRQNLIAAEEAFQANVSERWNRKSESYIAALDDPQAKASLRSIMREVRKNSGTKKQYKSETLEDVLKDVKQMHKYARASNAEMFAKTAWEAAEKIIDDIDYNDDLYEKYVGVKKYLDKARIVVPEEYFYMQDFAEFARSIQGFVRFYADGISLEKAYGQLSKKYPDLFPSDVNNAVDMLMQIADVIDYTLPYRETYSSEEYSSLVEEVASNLCALVENGKDYKTTIEKLKVDAMNQRHQEALRKAEARHQEQLDESNARTEAQRQRAEKWKQRYNDRVQKGIKDRKERSEKEDHRKYFTRIQKNYKKLCDWVLKPTKEKNVPEEFRKSLAEFLQTLDLQTENSKKLEAKTGHVGQKTLKLRELKDRLNALAKSKTTEDGDYISGGFEIDAYAAHLMDMLSDKYDGKSVDELDALAIRDIDVVLKTIIKNIQRYKQVKTETKMAEISDVGGRGVEFLKAKIDRDGPYSKRKGAPGALQTINATALTPPYLFERLGPIKEMYDALRHNGFDTYIRNEKMIIDRLADILGKYNKTNRKGQNMPGSIVEEWRDERSAQTIQLTYGSVTMSVAQMMSLYCLSKRGEQALGHMLVGGIKTTPIQTTSKIAAEEKEKMSKAARLAKRTKNAAGNYVKSRFKGETETAEKLVLTYDDVQTIISKLTPDQKDVADKLQNLMSVDMARLGNEAHRELYGYEMFDEDFYFPIKVDSNQRETDINTIGEVFEKIKSFGFAKPLTPNANKAIIIDDIFSIVADHCNGMNLYNSYLVPITDFMKVLNYTHTFEDGTTLSMKDAIEQAYGKDMLKYVLNLMKDINGIKAENRGGLEGLMNKAIGRAKKTAVFGNVRVALQQPTAIVRAAAEINPKYLKGVNLPQTVASYAPIARYTSKAMEEMWKYCPIAQWKAWGYYDTYMGKDIEDVMMNNWSIGDDILSGYYGQLDNATWAVIWQAVKAEQADKYPDMDHNSEEFLQICGRRASEVFDKTQVVDSTFHRSDAMRNKQVAVKIFTAFMAEPTLTLNVMRAGLFNASEEKKAGNKSKAAKILLKTLGIYIAQGVLVSAAQAVADAWRGKDPGLPWGDDDDDEEKAGYWLRWYHNFIYNCFGQGRFWENMYLVKDVTPYINYMISKGADYWNWNPTVRAVMGWDQDYLYSQNNLVFSALENTANGVAQSFKKLEKGDEYIDYNTKEPKRWYDINQKVASGLGSLLGIPAGTLLRDFKPIWDKLTPAVFAADTELMDAIANKMGYKPIEGSSRNTSSDNTDKTSVSTNSEEAETNVPTRESLPDNLTDEQKDEIIKSAEKRSKKATSEEEQGQLDYDTMLYNALKAASGLEGEEYNKKVYSSVANGLKGYIADGDYVSIGMMRTVIEEAGGDVEYFDKRVLEETKSAYKKTLSYDLSYDERWDQKAMYRYMMAHGMTQEELSNDVLYSSELAKDMKVAYRFGDNNMIYEAMLPLVDAGITRTDLERLYENRNKMDLAKYKKTGRYKDKLKSMGTFIWPATGPITSHFGYRTDVASVGGSTDHPAIDIGIPVGTPVVAADGGVVILAGSNYGYGYSVGIKHDNGMVTYYNHLDSWNVKVGDTVAQGQQIACSGNTGRSTGPHLDFKILDKNGKPVDPEKLLSGSI